VQVWCTLDEWFPTAACPVPLHTFHQAFDPKQGCIGLFVSSQLTARMKLHDGHVRAALDWFKLEVSIVDTSKGSHRSMGQIYTPHVPQHQLWSCMRATTCMDSTTPLPNIKMTSPISLFNKHVAHRHGLACCNYIRAKLVPKPLPGAITAGSVVQAMLVDLLAFSFKIQPDPTAAAVTALVAAAHHTSAEPPSGPMSSELCYTWDPRMTCVTALFLATQQCIHGSGDAAPAPADIQKLLLEWLKSFAAGAW
jgi:hypothetical protein